MKSISEASVLIVKKESKGKNFNYGTISKIISIKNAT